MLFQGLFDIFMEGDVLNFFLLLLYIQIVKCGYLVSLWHGRTECIRIEYNTT